MKVVSDTVVATGWQGIRVEGRGRFVAAEADQRGQSIGRQVDFAVVVRSVEKKSIFPVEACLDGAVVVVAAAGRYMNSAGRWKEIPTWLVLIGDANGMDVQRTHHVRIHFLDLRRELLTEKVADLGRMGQHSAAITPFSKLTLTCPSNWSSVMKSCHRPSPV